MPYLVNILISCEYILSSQQDIRDNAVQLPSSGRIITATKQTPKGNHLKQAVLYLFPTGKVKSRYP